jgi:maltose alpha-D-glucosyltransferase/alpha-amylase
MFGLRATVGMSERSSIKSTSGLSSTRRWRAETILAVNNPSNAAQAVELDLRSYKGNILIEMFGKNIFPRVGELPYLLTPGPYQFYWFRLRRI